MGIETILLSAAIAGTAGSIYSTQQAGRASRRQMEAEQRKAEIQNVRNVRQSIREARLSQASIESQGALSGALMGTGVAGGMSSVSAQLGGNLNYISSIAEENTNIFNAGMAASRASTNATIFGQVGQLAGSAYQGISGETIGATIGKKLKG
jgi:hypothetical protein